MRQKKKKKKKLQISIWTQKKREKKTKLKIRQKSYHTKIHTIQRTHQQQLGSKSFVWTNFVEKEKQQLVNNISLTFAVNKQRKTIDR